MSEPSEPTTPVDPATADRRRARVTRRLGAASRNRVIVLITGLALGAVITGGAALAVNEFGDEDHGRTEAGDYHADYDGDRDDGARAPREYTGDSEDADDAPGQTAPGPAAPAPVAPAPPPAAPAPPTN